MTTRDSKTQDKPDLEMPPGVIDAAAVGQHEMVASYQRAGFSRAEAVQILIAIITSSAATGWANPGQ